MNFITYLHGMVSKHTVLNARRFSCALMKTETFENADAIFHRFYSVDHNNKNYNNSNNNKK